MTSWVALLRAVNVGGTGKLAMSDLKALCDEVGFIDARTYIASGNVVFKSPKNAPKVKSVLEAALHALAGKPVGVHLRSADEMLAVVRKNPFPGDPGNRVIAIFLDDAPPRDTIAKAKGRAEYELIALGTREIYVRYGEAMGHSKLRIPAALTGTGRNINTVTKLATMATG